MDPLEDAKELPKPFDNPWFQEAYKAALQFYAKDNVLTSEDRKALALAYTNIGNTQSVTGWLGFSVAFFTPLGLRYYRKNTIKGTNIPRCFMAGLLALFIGTHFGGEYAYKKQMKLLDPNETLGSTQELDHFDTISEDQQIKSPTQRRFEMMTLLKNGSSPKWAAYFKLTSEHPERRLPNPKVRIKELIESKERRSGFMNQRDPIGLYSNQEVKHRHIDKDKNKDEQNIYGKSWANVRNEHDVASSWDRIREPDSFANLEKGNDSDIFSASFFDNDDNNVSAPYSVGASSQDDFEKLLERERAVTDDD